MKQYEKVQKHDYEHLNRSLPDKVTVANRYRLHRPELLTLLDKVDSMWDGHLWKITRTKHCIKLAHNDARLIHSAPYTASPVARQFPATQVDRRLQEDVV